MPVEDFGTTGAGNDRLRVSAQNREIICGRLPLWIKVSALVRYLQGEMLTNPQDFTDDPWDIQILPHIKIQSDSRQVDSEDGYFTEAAVRLRPYWALIAGLNIELPKECIRLGGEGHRALVEPLPSAPMDWQSLSRFLSPANEGPWSVYVLTPGLAQVSDTEAVYGLYPKVWRTHLEGCVGDRPLLWGGMSSYWQKKADGSESREVGFLPQRAFVTPGTIYRFHTRPQADRLLPQLAPNNRDWLKTFYQLGYGTLLWGKP
jgi:CRISPR-associated protein Cmr3